jgi:hypothetical protein
LNEQRTEADPVYGSNMIELNLCSNIFKLEKLIAHLKISPQVLSKTSNGARPLLQSLSSFYFLQVE